MKRALLLECGRFRAYVNDGKVHIDPAESLEVLSRDDASDLAEVVQAAKTELAASVSAQPMNESALRQMISNQYHQSMLQSLGNMFGRGVQAQSPYGFGGRS